MGDNKTTFPQADHFEKVIRIMSVDSAYEIKDREHMSEILGGITSRQVQYYLSACEYLGLITSDRTFTAIGEKILVLPYAKKVIQLARVLISDPIFGSVYLAEKKFRYKFDSEEIISVMRAHSSMSEPLYKRRAQTVSSWVKWLNDVFNDSFENE